MRILFFTDTHIRGTNPKSRKDDFFETLKLKFKEIASIIKEKKIDFVIHGGDWFDRPDTAPNIVKEFAKILITYNCPIYTVAGNHDIFGHNPETLGRTMLGLIEGVGIIEFIDNKGKLIEINNKKLMLYGSSYRYDIDAENKNDVYIIKKPIDVDYCINVVHGMLLEKPFFDWMKYTQIHEIIDTEADITLAGHYHNGFGIKKFNDKYFVNPGSLVRITNSEAEMERMPEVIIIELEDGIDIQALKLETAKSGDEVLEKKQLMDMKEKGERIQAFYGAIFKDEKHKKINLEEILEEIASNDNIEVEIKNEALDRIAKARESMSTKRNGVNNE